MKKVGKVKEAHGLKGEITILIFSQDISWLPNLKKCEIQSGPSLKSLEVVSTRPFKKGFILKAKEINNRNESEAIEGWDFLIPEELLVSQPGETIYLNEILNFKALDMEGCELGLIIDFSSNGVQDLLVIKKVNGTSAEVPFVPAFVQKIDFEQRCLYLSLPEGLLDLESVED